MKRIAMTGFLLLSCLCIAQTTEADFPAGVRIFFSDGTDMQLACTQDGNCRVIRGTSTLGVTRINLGFKMKHGYTLLVP